MSRVHAHRLHHASLVPVCWLQMKGKVYHSTLHAFTTMLKTEGIK